MNSKKIFEGLLTAYILSLFLSMGNDLPGHLMVRYAAGGVLALYFIVLSLFNRRLPTLSISLIFLGIFLAFEWGRAVLALNAQIGPAELRAAYLKAPLFWSFYALIFLMAAQTYDSRPAAGRLFKCLAWICFFIAVNVIPAILIQGHAHYAIGDGRGSFFLPILYFHPWIPRYLLSRFGHPNYSGDLMALGFYAALALAWYAGDLFFDRRRKFLQQLKEGRVQPGDKPPLPLNGILYLFIALVTGAGVLLLFSRGTIVFWLISVLIFLVMVLLKWRSRRVLIITIAILVLGGGFSGWTVNLPKVWNELQTLRQEQQGIEKGPIRGAVGQNKSIYTNREGFRRALAISADYPFWGVGTQGYGIVSKKYEKEGWERYALSRYYAMNHYLHMLAEEGLGALLYFSFLFVYGWEVLRNLFKIKSRFQGFICLAFTAWLAMIFGHALINYFLENITFSLLAHAMMGALAGISRQNFLVRNS